MTSEPIFVPLREYNWSLAHFGVLPWNPTVYCLIALFYAVALWLSIEITVQVWLRFKRHKALYFWSILITTWGISGHTVAFILKLFVPGVDEIGTTFLAKVSWVANTTGFSLVLYSRLHLVLGTSSMLPYVLAVIFMNAVFLHTPVIVFSFAMSTSHGARWVPYMDVAERIQIVGFTIQEFVLSSIYTYTTWELLRSAYSTRLRNILVLLILAQTAVFCSDLAMVVVDYLDMFTLKASMHPFIYAIKLKIEFVVLNQLRGLVQHGLAPGDLEVLVEDESQYQSSSSGCVSAQRPSPVTWQPSSQAASIAPLVPAEELAAKGSAACSVCCRVSTATSGSDLPPSGGDRELASGAMGHDTEAEKGDRLWLGSYR